MKLTAEIPDRLWGQLANIADARQIKLADVVLDAFLAYCDNQPPLVAVPDRSREDLVKPYGTAETRKKLNSADFIRQALEEQPMTTEEIRKLPGAERWSRERINSAVSSLAARGHIADSGEKRYTENGRVATVWRLP